MKGLKSSMQMDSQVLLLPSSPLTPPVFHFLLVAEQLWVHAADDAKQRLHGGVVGNGATPLGVAAHAVDEDLQAGLQCSQELALVSLC